MRKRIITLLVCIIVVSTLCAMGKSSSTSIPAADSTSTEVRANFKRGITFKYDDTENLYGTSFSMTFYDDGTFFYIDYSNGKNNSVYSYFLVDNELYTDSAFASLKLGLEFYNHLYMYGKVGFISDDEAVITLDVYRNWSRHNINLTRE